jgi:lysine 2,3-aminomutase
MLASHRPLWINTQFNHPAELTEASIGACDRLLRAGIPVSNQAVLLKGVNDRVETMRNLCTQLQKIMVRPYYVFLCDPVAGTGHFATPARLGMEMERELRNTIGGLAMPRFVADLPGSRGKTPLGEVLEREETIR